MFTPILLCGVLALAAPDTPPSPESPSPADTPTSPSAPERRTKFFGDLEVVYPAGYEAFADAYGEWLSGSKEAYVEEFRASAREIMNFINQRKRTLLSLTCDAYALDAPTPKMTSAYEAFADQSFGDVARDFNITRANIWERNTLIEVLKQHGPVDGFHLNEEGRPECSFGFGVKHTKDSDEPEVESLFFDMPVVINLEKQPTLPEQMDEARKRTEEIFHLFQHTQFNQDSDHRLALFYVLAMLINMEAWHAHFEEDHETPTWISMGLGYAVASKTFTILFGPEDSRRVTQLMLKDLRTYGSDLYDLDLQATENIRFSTTEPNAAFALSCAVIEDIIEQHGEEVFTIALSQLPVGEGTMPQFYAAFETITGEDIRDFIEPARARLITEYETLPTGEGGQQEEPQD
jgi:hypothetical protein